MLIEAIAGTTSYWRGDQDKEPTAEMLDWLPYARGKRWMTAMDHDRRKRSHHVDDISPSDEPDASDTVIDSFERGSGDNQCPSSRR